MATTTNRGTIKAAALIIMAAVIMAIVTMRAHPAGKP